MKLFRQAGIYLLFAMLLTMVSGCGGDGDADNQSNSERQAKQLGSKQSQQVRRFVDDLKTWQDAINLSPEQTSFQGVGEVAAGVATKELTEIIQVIAVAGQQATLVALPELYLEAACDRLDLVSGFLCHQLIADKTLEELCNSTLNLEILGKSLCVWLDDIRWPVDAGEALMGNSLYNQFGLLNGTANLLGYDAGTDIALNVQLTESGFLDNEVYFSVSGDIQQGESQLLISNGAIEYYFESLDGSGFEAPHSMAFQFQISMQNLAATEGDVEFNGSVSGSVTFGERKPFRELIGLDKLAIDMRAQGEFSNDQSKQFPAELAISNRDGTDFALLLQVQTNDLNKTAQVSYESVAATQTKQETPLSFTIAWDDKAYEVVQDDKDANKVTVRNQEQVTMDLDYGQTGDANTLGEIRIDGLSVGQVIPLNGSLLITLEDGTELVL